MVATAFDFVSVGACFFVATVPFGACRLWRALKSAWALSTALESLFLAQFSRGATSGHSPGYAFLHIRGNGKRRASLRQAVNSSRKKSGPTRRPRQKAKRPVGFCPGRAWGAFSEDNC
jgi:hypothetical protein